MPLRRSSTRLFLVTGSILTISKSSLLWKPLVKDTKQHPNTFKKRKLTEALSEGVTTEQVSRLS